MCLTVLDLGITPTHRKAQLKEFITLHSQVGGGPLSIDEMVIMKGALDMREKTVTDAMVLVRDFPPSTRVHVRTVYFHILSL